MTAKQFKQLRSSVPCWCTPRSEMDICRHADSSVDCPRHSQQAFADYLYELEQSDSDTGYASGSGLSEPSRFAS